MNEAPGCRCGPHRTLTVWLVLAVLLPTAARAQSIEEKAQVCAACHGENGAPVEQSFPVPVIWGQQLGYLFFELRDFKSGARKNDQMAPIAEGLEQADLMPLAQYFSKKAWPDLQQPAAMCSSITSAATASSPSHWNSETRSPRGDCRDGTGNGPVRFFGGMALL